MKRPDSIENYLSTVKTGTWFSFTDSKNKTYENLIINDGSTKPTEKECTDGLAALQAEWDLENASYRSKRREAYPSQQEQFDMQYWDQINGTTTWKDAIAKVKSDYPKPSNYLDWLVYKNNSRIKIRDFF